MPSIKKFILDLFFPVNCLGCGQETTHHPSEKSSGGFICPVCFEQMPLNRETPLKFNRDSALTGLIIASHYKHPLVKQAIHQYKYDFVKDLSEPLGLLMIKKLIQTKIQGLTLQVDLRFDLGSRDLFEVPLKRSNLKSRLKGRTLIKKSNLELNPNIILIPVPLHKKRLRWRGFNQAELLALEISQHLNIPIANNILIRTKHNLPQVNIKSSQERKENIKQAFEIGSDPAQQGQTLMNKTLILIDDVFTTGATLKECAKVLKPLQLKQIWGLVVARG